LIRLDKFSEALFWLSQIDTASDPGPFHFNIYMTTLMKLPRVPFWMDWKNLLGEMKHHFPKLDPRIWDQLTYLCQDHKLLSSFFPELVENDDETDRYKETTPLNYSDDAATLTSLIQSQQISKAETLCLTADDVELSLCFLKYCISQSLVCGLEFFHKLKSPHLLHYNEIVPTLFTERKFNHVIFLGEELEQKSMKPTQEIYLALIGALKELGRKTKAEQLFHEAVQRERSGDRLNSFGLWSMYHNAEENQDLRLWVEKKTKPRSRTGQRSNHFAVRM